MDGIPTCQDDKACKGAEAPLAVTHTHTHNLHRDYTMQTRPDQTLRQTNDDAMGGRAHNVSEMGRGLIWAQNSMPQNSMKIKLEIPGVL